MHFSEKILAFLTGIRFTVPLPPDVEVMNPFTDAETMAICNLFYRKYYANDHERWMIIGINPGRHGGGITGIPFTDPIRLQRDCQIENQWAKRQELSSVFMYQMINGYGGPMPFYRNFYITAVSPLGFTKHNKNLNYYDDRILQQNLKPFVVDCLKQQLEFGIRRNAVFCLGEGKNFQYVQRLNAEFHFFDKVVPLPHPRFIMQYRLKRKEEYIQYYLKQFQALQ